MSLGSHEGDDDIQVRLLLGLEVCCHLDIPIHASLAGQLGQERFERGRMVESIQLLDLGQVAVYLTPTSIELLKLGSVGGGCFRVPVVIEVGNTFGG